MGSREGRLAQDTDFKVLLHLYQALDLSYSSPPGLHGTPLDLLALLQTPQRSSKISGKLASLDFHTSTGSLFSLLFICSLLASGHCSRTPALRFPLNICVKQLAHPHGVPFPFISFSAQLVPPFNMLRYIGLLSMPCFSRKWIPPKQKN